MVSNEAWHAGGEYTDLAGSIDNVTVIFNALVIDTLRESVLDGRVVRVDELVLSELYDEGRLSCCRKRTLLSARIEKDELYALTD